MPHCIAFGCASHDGRLPRHIRLHCFPKDREKCRIWAQNLGIDSGQMENFLDKTCSNTAKIRCNVRICTRHFESRYLEIGYRCTLPRIELKSGAIPTLFHNKGALPQKQTTEDDKRINVRLTFTVVHYYDDDY